MDEFFHERLEELKSIKDEIERILLVEYPDDMRRALAWFKDVELAHMIERAEEAYRKF